MPGGGIFSSKSVRDSAGQPTICLLPSHDVEVEQVLRTRRLWAQVGAGLYALFFILAQSSTAYAANRLQVQQLTGLPPSVPSSTGLAPESGGPGLLGPYSLTADTTPHEIHQHYLHLNSPFLVPSSCKGYAAEHLHSPLRQSSAAASTVTRALSAMSYSTDRMTSVRMDCSPSLQFNNLSISGGDTPYIVS